MALINKQIYRRILDKKERLDTIQSLPTESSERLKKELTIKYIYNSDAIEGSGLSFKDTRHVIEEFYRM
jgi:Fic family protein